MHPMNVVDVWRGELVASVALVVVIFILRGIAVRAIRMSRLTRKQRRRWLVQVRTATVLILVFGVTVIWAEELRTFAISLMAIAVAVTIATKELFLGLSGALLRTSSHAFVLGDRIQVGAFRGDVIDIGALSTKLLEIDDVTNRRTGRSISLPNAMLLDRPTINESFGGSYVLTHITVPLGKSVSWPDAEKLLLDAAREVCAPFLSDAKEKISEVSRKEGLDPPIIEPTVTLIPEKADEIKLVLRFPTPVRKRGRIGQAILRRFLEASARVSEEFRDSVEQSLEQ